MSGSIIAASDKDTRVDMSCRNMPEAFVCASALLIPLRRRRQWAGVHRRRRRGRQAGEVLFGRTNADFATTLAHMVYCCVC